MPKLRFFGAALIFLLLAGCATTGRATWTGHSESELISSLGPPDSVRPIDASQKILTYHTFSYVFPPGYDPEDKVSYIGNTAVYPPGYNVTPAQNKGGRCKIDFVIKDQRVVSWQYEGKGCNQC